MGSPSTRGSALASPWSSLTLHSLKGQPRPVSFVSSDHESFPSREQTSRRQIINFRLRYLDDLTSEAASNLSGVGEA